MLYPTELSSGGRTGFEPVANGLRRCSTSELSSARGTSPSRSPAYATAAPRAPDGSCEPMPLWTVRAMFRIGASSKAPIRLRCIAHRPCRSIKARRMERLRGYPCLGPASPDASGARCNRVLIVWVSFSRTPKTKRPRVLEPEGVRVASGDRGDRSPRCERISRCGWCRSNSASRAVKAHRAVRTRAGPHRACAMASGWRCGVRASWESDGSCDRRDGEGRAPYSRRFCLATKFLHHRRTARIMQRAGKKEARIAAGLFCIRRNGRLT